MKSRQFGSVPSRHASADPDNRPLYSIFRIKKFFRKKFFKKKDCTYTNGGDWSTKYSAVRNAREEKSRKSHRCITAAGESECVEPSQNSIGDRSNEPAPIPSSEFTRIIMWLFPIILMWKICPPWSVFFPEKQRSASLVSNWKLKKHSGMFFKPIRQWSGKKSKLPSLWCSDCLSSLPRHPLTVGPRGTPLRALAIKTREKIHFPSIWLFFQTQCRQISQIFSKFCRRTKNANFTGRI